MLNAALVDVNKYTPMSYTSPATAVDIYCTAGSGCLCRFPARFKAE